MAVGSAIAVYFIIWWVTLFAVLPFGISSQAEAGEVAHGSDPGAPAAARLGRVALINSVVAFVVFCAFWAFYVLNVFDLQVVRDLRRE
jgi:predicted secreted protein